MSINEKLAELCGKSFVENDGNSFAESCALMGRPMVYEGNGVFKDWNPIQDLNQLKMCYEALSEEEKAFVHIKFAVPFNDMTNKWPSDRDNLFAVFTHPELVAQAILKAKGGS